MPARVGTVDQAVRILRGGGLAVFPTETLWSLSCRADDLVAVGAIFAAKNRPGGVPLALGVDSLDAVREDLEVTPLAEALAKHFLPGPLSIILRRKSDRWAHLAPDRDTVSVRVPDHPLALQILQESGPLVMTSANRHGQPDPRSQWEVMGGLAHVNGLVFVEAPPVPGTGSTVVDATGDAPVVLREGMVSATDLAGIQA